MIENKYIQKISDNALHIAFYVSLLGTLGSLALSLILSLPPCDYCWYQRIFMYGITVLTGAALVRKDRSKNLFIYILAFTIPGLLIAVYHYIYQLSGGETLALGCTSTAVNCSEPQIQLLGFITIPLMSAIAFIIILIPTWLRLKSESNT